MNKQKRMQMSESMWTVAFITISGGLQDAYTYFARDKVFANAQTGNIVLMSSHFFSGDFIGGIHYLIPLLSFAAGIAAAEQIDGAFHKARKLHWRQIVLIAEIILLFISGLTSSNIIATSLVSMACAMQVQAFRKAHGNAYASTMCIGNLRAGVSYLSHWFRTKNHADLHHAAYYFTVILLFAAGAGTGYLLTSHLGMHTIWISCPLLACALALMFMSHE